MHENRYWSNNICARQLSSLHNYSLVFFYIVYLKNVLLFRTWSMCRPIMWQGGRRKTTKSLNSNGYFRGFISMRIFGNEFVVCSYTVTCEILERKWLLYWNSKYIEETALCKAGLEKPTVISALSKTSNQFITADARLLFQGKIL
jgi:hypothetical protein